jgi:hypothetical protein
MTIDVMSTALMTYLEGKNLMYFVKVKELRDELTGWLSYVPNTFPHYTRHTIEHSEQIVLQLSKLLFYEENPTQPTVPLASIEAYILIASAFLHDAGMVASDKEKLEIMNSDAWQDWTQNGGGARRWDEILKFRAGSMPAEKTQRDFLADVQTRFLIAEFVRLRHHFRAADVIQQHQSALGRFAFDDTQLERSIADVCIAHGLHSHELEDAQRYPERRDIRGEFANLRFLAILLRIGDLLDMSSDRACPLLMNAACPLPSESLAHWSQYKRITHRMTAPDRIEISAECDTQDEHRLLQDWCHWLVDEIEKAGTVMAQALRHRTWQPPYVSMGAFNQTIQIRPSTKASYIPSKWVFEFDRDAVIQRLVHDVHPESILFVLELIQNALDATRCRMYADLISRGSHPSEDPTSIDIRRRYPIRITTRLRKVQNPLSGEIETKQSLSVEDFGVGMDRTIIEPYFLQIGRSYVR